MASLSQRWLSVSLVLLLAASCQCAPDDSDGAARTPGPSQASDERFFERVIPILEARCGLGCHGAPADRYLELLARTGELLIPIDPTTGRIPDDEALRRLAFDVTRGAWRSEGDGTRDGAGDADEAGREERIDGTPRIDYQAAPEFSGLLRQPLSEAYGGLPHRGHTVFGDPADPDYLALSEWVELELSEHPEPAPALSAAQTIFRDEVIGVLERNGCFLGSCHGAMVSNDFKLIAPLPRLDHSPGAAARLSPRMVAANRAAALGEVARLVNLGGDLGRSRLIVKNLPLSQGGVHQRGGNVQLFEGPDDPDVKTLVRWMTAERAELAGRLTSGGAPVPEQDLGRLQGVAYLRGPRHAPRRFFDLDRFWPGTALMMLPDGADAPHTLVGGEGVEIQGFDVRYDARAVVLSMRTAAGEGLQLHELDLDAELRLVPGSLRRISGGPPRRPDGETIHHIDPIYVPGPGDPQGHVLDDVAVVFASNAAGDWAISDTFGLLGEADETPTGPADRRVIVDRQRTERPGTFDGRRLTIVAGPSKGRWRTIVRHRSGGRLLLDAPLPGAADPRTVYVIDKLEADVRPAYDIWRTAPGRWEGTTRRMTFTAAQERRPTMRTSGEVMFTSVRNRGYQADRPVFNGAIFRVMAGGFDYHVQGGNRSGLPLHVDSRELPSGLEVRLALDPRNLWGGGAPLLVDHGLGVHLEADNPVDDLPFTGSSAHHRTSSQRFLPAQVPLFDRLADRGITVTGLSPGGSFRDVVPLPDGTLLAAHAKKPLDHLSPDADPDWDLVRLRFAGALQSEDAQRAGPVLLEPIAAASTPDAAELHPRPVTVRIKERPFTHQKFAPHAAGAAPRRIDGVLRMPPDTPAEVECYDYPLLQSFLTHFAPVGGRDLRQDVFRFVRIVEQIPPTREDLAPIRREGADADPFASAVGLGVHTRQRIVSEIPLEPDGSFYARVPTQVPLIVQGLGPDRMAIHSMNRWFYVQPGERLTLSIPRPIFATRCGNCHGALTGDRKDALGPPDVTTAASRVLATWDEALDERRAAHPAAPISIDFQRDVQPILQRRCVRCHGGEGAPAGGLDLRPTPDGPWTVAYTSLHRLEEPASGDHGRKRYINEREALSFESPLMELVTGRSLGAHADWVAPGKPHPDDPPLHREEVATLARWIDLGATFLGTRE